MNSQEQASLDKYNAILKNTQRKAMTSAQLAKILKITSEAARFRCNTMVNFGYMESERIEQGRYRSKTDFYKAKVKSFPLEHYQKIIDAALAAKKLAGQRVGTIRRKGREKPVEPPLPTLADGVYKHDMDKMSKKYREQSQQARLERKSAKVYAQSSTNMI